MKRGGRIVYFLLTTFLISSDLFAARNVTCRAMDASGKILGVYVHTSKDDPVCSCDNPEVPKKYKALCAKSRRAF